MDQKLLIVSHRKGFEADHVIDGLRDRKLPFFRLNLDNGENASLFSFDIGKKDFSLSCDGRIIRAEEIACGWFQQGAPFQGQPQDGRQTLQNENLLACMTGLFSLSQFPWLNHPERVRVAKNKIIQLKAALDSGMMVPRTVVSNNPAEVRGFCKDSRVIGKNLATPWLTHGEQGPVAAYSVLISQEMLVYDEALSFSPVIYQDFHERRRDHRVVVVGDQHFVVSCKPQDHQYVDVRKGDSVESGFVRSEFPEEELIKLRGLMRRLGLNYCSADFIEDLQGNLYFIDLNSCGSWWWVDEHHEGAIRQALVDELVSMFERNLA